MIIRHDLTELFPLSLADAAHQLGLQPGDVAELVRVGTLTALLCARGGVGDEDGAAMLRFRAEDLDILRADTTSDSAFPRRLVMVRRLLTDYLDAHLAPDAAASATVHAEASPVLARDRGDLYYAHLQVRPFAAWVQQRVGSSSSYPVELVLYGRSVLRSALHYLGCHRMRGIRPLGSTEQQWGEWWRVPHELWSLISAETRGTAR